jgi:catechol 2,3-dioxygenase-like lactoylglutathione lyase family enzyme
MATGEIVRRLDLVFYWVSDLDRAVSFYSDVLGLSIARRDGNNWAEFDAGGRRFALHSAAPGQTVAPGGAAAVFTVGDLDEAKAALAPRGVLPDHEGDVSSYARFASFRDPDGNVFQLIEYAEAPGLTSA